MSKKPYLSFNTNQFRLIWNGMPLTIDKPTAQDAINAFAHYNPVIDDRAWNGDALEWVSLSSVLQGNSTTQDMRALMTEYENELRCSKN